MTERQHAQLTLTSIVLFGLAIPSPEELMDPELRKIDGLLDDAALVDRRRCHAEALASQRHARAQGDAGRSGAALGGPAQAAHLDP